MKKLAAVAMLPLLLAANVHAQEQPAEARNSQDEIINLDRSVDADTDSFKILRSGDKAEINRYVTKVYQLQHANPFELRPYLRSIASLEKGNVITAWNLQDNAPTKSWIQVNVPEFQIPYIDAVIQAYDVENFTSTTGDIKFSYRTKYRSAVEVADFIRSTSLSPDGSILGDSTTNTLYVQDSPSDFRRVLAQIQFYDVPAPQVEVEVSIIELTDLDQTSLGLDWDAWKTALSGSATVYAESDRLESSATDGALNTSSRGLEGILSVDATAAARFLNYLVDRGKARTRAQTTLLVSNGTLATVNSGTGVPSFKYVFDRDLGKSVLTTIAPTGDVTAEGISLALVPVVAMEAARMEVAVSMRSPVAISRTGEPIFAQQDMNAELTLEQDQLYKIGGIRRATQATQRKGIPLLKGIPGINFLFSNEAVILRESEIYIFLQPKWRTPQLVDHDGMEGGKVVRTEMLANILRENPNLSISPEDAAVLQRYFETRENE